MKKLYPFKFLDAYTRDDSPFFFGREEEIRQLYEMVFQSDLIVVYGASGTGKSSLIQCGLASRFQTHEWQPLFIRRGGDLNKSLEKVLVENGGVLNAEDEHLEWLEQDAKTGSEVSDLPSSDLSNRFRNIYRKNFRPIYLIFDQFEELYILGTKKEQSDFIATVKEILKLGQPVRVIISIREEYLGHLYEFERQVPQLLRKKLRVEPMTIDKVTDVIIGVGNQPLSIVDIEKKEETEFAEQVFTRLKVKENQINIELPYLQVFLDTMYLHITKDDTRQKEAVFTIGALNELGDIGDVLRNFVEDQVALATVKFNVKPEIIWKILSSFVTVQGTKEPLTINEVVDRLEGLNGDLIKEIIGIFEKKRILRYSETDENYEISHDSVAKQIHAHRTEDDINLLEIRSQIRYQSKLTDKARELFTSKQLEFFEPYLEKLTLTPAEQQLITLSRNAVKLKRRKKQGTIALMLIVVLGFSIYLFINLKKDVQRGNAILKEQFEKTIANAASMEDSADYDKARMFYWQAYSIDKYNDAFKDQALDSIFNCLKKLKYREVFGVFKKNADSLFEKREYWKALQYYQQARNTRYKNIDTLIHHKKAYALQLLKNDSVLYRDQSLPELITITRNDLDSIRKRIK